MAGKRGLFLTCKDRASRDPKRLLSTTAVGKAGRSD